MDDLIRGGQVSFHKIRMFCQVSKLFSYISVFLLIISVGYSYYREINLNEWKIGWNWLKVQVIEDNDYKVTYRTKNNQTRIVSAKAFISDSFVLKTIQKFETSLYKGLTIAAIMLSIILGSLVLYFWLKGMGIKKNKHLRGIFILECKQLKNELKKHNKIFHDYQPFSLADFPYPITGRKESWSAGEQAHAMLIGSTGAGKTKIIQNLVYQLHQRNQKAIIVDVKGDYIEHFYREGRGDIILNPLDKRGRNWSIFKETNPLKGFATISKSLLPRESKSDPIWIDAARNVFAELANLYVSENLSMAEFADKLLKTDLITLNKLLDKTGASRIVNPDIEKAALSVLMVLSTYLKPLKLYQSSKDIFSITDWVNDESQNNFLFISSKADVKEDINPLITTQVDIAVNALRSLKIQSNVPKTWFILDEIPYFDQPIPNLKDGLAMARSYGGCFVLGTQDMSSLSKIYSEETARSIANNCKTKIYMNIAGKETAHWCSQSLGEGEIEEWHEGLSYGAHEMRDGIQVNRNKVIRPVVLPSELTMLKAGEGFIQFAGFKPAKFKFNDQSFKRISTGYLENDELLTLFISELEQAEKRRKLIEARLLENSNKQEDIEIKPPKAKEHKIENQNKKIPEVTL
jgi:type IV conjugative transfer system coupling protein TraD